MSVDNNYQNNLVITEDAFQELLTNIKNFPIIDIEYIAPNQEENDNNIWQTHNNGKPCLRVTYGNLDRKTYIFQDSSDAESYKQLQTQLKQLKLIRAKCNYAKSKFEKAWEDNADLLKEKIEIQKELSRIYPLLENKKREYFVAIAKLINPFYGFPSPEEHPNFFENFEATFKWDVIHLDHVLGQDGQQVQLQLVSDVILDSLLISLSSDSYNELTNKDALVSFIKNFNTFVILDTLTGYTLTNLKNLINSEPKIIPYLNFPIPESSYDKDQLNNALEQLYAASTSKIKDNLNSLNDYINKLKAIIDYLDGITTAPIEDIQEEFIQAIRIPELHSYIQTETSRLVFNKSIPTIKNDIEILEAKEGNTTLEGISYVDVGDQIAFENNFPIPTDEQTNADKLLVKSQKPQASGTFRIDINDKTYEVPIRGFTAQENDQPENDQPIEINSSESITLNSTDIKSKSITPLTNNESLGSQNTPWANIYVKDLHVSASDNGNKTTKFLREDGRWSNELTDKLVLGHVASQEESQTNNTCLLVQNETDAIRKIENKPVVSYTPVTDLSAIGTVTYYEDETGQTQIIPTPAKYEFINELAAIGSDVGATDAPVRGFEFLEVEIDEETKQPKFGEISVVAQDPDDTSIINYLIADNEEYVTKEKNYDDSKEYNICYYDANIKINNYNDSESVIKRVWRFKQLKQIEEKDFNKKILAVYTKTSGYGSGWTSNSGKTYYFYHFTNPSNNEAVISDILTVDDVGSFTTDNPHTWYYDTIDNLLKLPAFDNNNGIFKGKIIERKEQPAGAYAVFSNFNDSSKIYCYINDDGEYEQIQEGSRFYAANGVFIKKEETVSAPDPAVGYFIGKEGSYSGSIVTYGGIAAGKSIKAAKVHGAVFNDYAEYRHTDNIAAGRCVIETGKGDLILSSQRLQLGANITTDTFGFSIGETNYANTPIAVCGRVLAYPYEDCVNFTPGAAVCSGPNGTISVMSREEIRNWPDAIIGYVSEIPTYDKWGSDQIDVNGRIWIKIK